MTTDTILCVYNTATSERAETPLTRHAILDLLRAWNSTHPEERIIIEEIRIPRTDAQREDEDDGERSARKIEIEVIEVTPAANAGLSWDVAVRVGGVDGAVTMTRDRYGDAVRCDGGGTSAWLSPELHGLPRDVLCAIEQAAGAAIQSSGVEPSADARDD